MTLAIGVDVGGTKVAAAVVDEGGRILAKLKRSTPAASPTQTEQAIADVVTELLARHQVVAIGLGAAGFVDCDRATMLFAPNLAWRDEPLKQRVEERLGREVVVENDANASAWAEARFGAARGYRDVMLVAVGRASGPPSSSAASSTGAAGASRGNPGTSAWSPTVGCAAAGTGAAGSSTAAATPWSPRPVNSPGARQKAPCGCCS